MTEKKYQIFVSSTFEDLKDERRAISEQILNLGHLPVGMELFHASNEDQWSHIVRRIKQCDYYLVIVAERYGSTDTNGISFTEKEYRLAVRERLPVAAFLLSDSARKSWPQQFVETRQLKKINAFRSLCKKKLIKYWSSPADLALGVSNSLSNLFVDHPRPGLVSSVSVPSAKTLDTLAHLAEKVKVLEAERDTLRVELASLRKSASLQQIRDSLQKVTLQDISRRGQFEWCEEVEAESGGQSNDGPKALKPIELNLDMWTIITVIFHLSPGEIDGGLLDRIVSARMGKKISARRVNGSTLRPWSHILNAFERAGLMTRTAVQKEMFAPFGGSKSKYTHVYFSLTDLSKRLFRETLTIEQLLLGEYRESMVSLAPHGGSDS